MATSTEQLGPLEAPRRLLVVHLSAYLQRVNNHNKVAGGTSGRPVGRVVGRWDEWSAGGTSGRPVGRVVGRWDEWSAGGTSGRPVGRVVGRWDEWSAGGTSGRPVGRVVGRWDEWSAGGTSGRPVGRVVRRWDEWSAGGTSGPPVGRVVRRWDEWSAGGTRSPPVGQGVRQWDKESAGGTRSPPVGRVAHHAWTCDKKQTSRVNKIKVQLVCGFALVLSFPYGRMRRALQATQIQVYERIEAEDKLWQGFPFLDLDLPPLPGKKKEY
ncbi:mucin-1-like [Syngnathus typhle]|uniref:mucin-1-like n=1 Tax=Syngnathus typhle TaxID=161592 RepID=UPI002A6ABBE3|nr:mucin-1-like [Syngnathus typhle]